MTKLKPFIVKRFFDDKQEWIVLGTIHATDIDDAWKIAMERWTSVDSVWPLDGMYD